MESNIKRERKIHLSKKNIFSLSKKLVVELTKHQLLKLMGIIARQLAGTGNDNRESTETFAESLELDTSQSEEEEEEVEETSNATESNQHKIVNGDCENSSQQNIQHKNRLKDMSKEIINRQCGQPDSPTDEDLFLRLRSSIFSPQIYNGIKEHISNIVDTPITDFIESSTSQNFNNMDDKEYLFNSTYRKDSLSKEVFSHSEEMLDTSKYYKNEKLGVTFTSNVGDIPLNVFPLSPHIEEKSNRIYNSGVEEKNYVHQYASFMDLFPINCVSWRPASPYLRNVSGIYRSCKSTEITRRLKPIHWPSKSNTRKKLSINKLKSINNLINTEAISKCSNTVVNISDKCSKVDNNIPSMLPGTNDLLKDSDLNKLVAERLHQCWLCTYTGCRHLNSTKESTCIRCFNPRWNYHSRFTRDFLCQKCGYVNYKTRINCKKCKHKFSRKLEKINRQPFIRSSLVTPIRI